jgi:phage shock protein C
MIMATGKKLLRSNDRWIAGICGGIADYFDWDPAMVRLIYVLLTVFTTGFPGTIIYLVLWLIMPKQ